MKKALIHIILLALIMAQPMMAQQQELTLNDAISKALENNYGISIARQETEIASINNNWGAAGRYPSVGFSLSQNNSFNLNTEEITNTLGAGIGADWVIFDGFRVKITKAILDDTEQLVSGRLSVLIENTIEDVTLAYYTILLQEEQLKVLREVMELSDDRYTYELKKKEIGSSVTYQVLQAENVYLSDKTAFLEQEMNVRSARRALNYILAETPDYDFKLVDSFEGDTASYQLADLQSKMLQNNQTLKNQYTNLLMQSRQTELKKSDYYPSLSTSFGVDYSLFNQSGTSSISSSEYGPYANFRLNYDIYNGGLRKQAMTVAKINEEISQTEFESMEHTLSNELFNLYDYHGVRIELLKVAESAENAAKLNLDLSLEKYRSGAINSFNYRDIQLIYVEASLRKLQAVYNLIESKAKLTRITGGYIQQ